MGIVRGIRANALVWLFLAASARAAAPGAPPVEGTTATEASREFELGVEHFDSAQFEASARAFLRADQLAPSSDALSNALISARRAGHHLLVVEVARRAIDRAASDPGLAASARTALAEASRHLSRVRLSCEPTPCELRLDGARVEAGTHYANPGEHTFLADFKENPALERKFSLDAGTEYEVRLTPTTPELEREASPAPAMEKSRAESFPLRDVVLYAGLGATAVLTACTIGSGVDALEFNAGLEDPSPEPLVRDGEWRALRTDILLGAAVGTGAFTLAWALFAPLGTEVPTDTGVAWSTDGAYVFTGGKWP